GASIVALNRPVAAELGLRGRRTASVGDNAGGTRSVSVVEVNDLELGAARFRGVDAVVVDLGFIVGGNRAIDGLLGFGLFADCLLTLDYPAKKVRLEQGVLPPHRGKDILRYQIAQRCPRVTLRLADRTVRLAVDSGSNGALTLPRSLRKKLRFHAPPVAMGRVQRTGGAHAAEIARVVGTLKVGRHQIADPLVRLFGRSGVLGNRILQHFAVSFDQRNALVRFVRASDNPITFPSVRSRGAYTERRGDVEVVVEVDAGSEAERLGLRSGDRIVAVNHRSCAELDRGEWTDLWNSAAPLHLDIRREGDTLSVTVPMVELVR
ncbi:MAG: hypothetical protein GY842_19130, partial [bacterium]|nr:hypothetical protein [bacterium]